MSDDKKETATLRIRNLELSFKGKRKVADGTTEIALGTEGINFAFRAGQYVRVTLPDLPTEVPGGNTRDFSISSSPRREDEILITFRDSDSYFKKALLDMQPGAKVLIYGPLGVFTLPENEYVSVILIAGGIGITPFMSMIRCASESKSPRQITLIYGNDNVSSATYIDELRSLSEENANFTLIEKIGLMDIELLRAHDTKDPNSLWYVCGQPTMVMSFVRDIPQNLNVSEFNIRTEEYVGYESVGKYKVFPSVAVDTSDTAIFNEQIVQPLIDAASQAALIAVTDAQGSILYANQKFIEVAKYSMEELMGQNHRILKSGHHPPEFYAELWETISSGKIWRGEIKNRAKDGTFYWVDTSVVPIFGKDKKINRYIAVRFLISDKKELEKKREELQKAFEEIEREKNKADIILQSIGDAVFAIDKEQSIVFLNPRAEELSGHSSADVIGKPYYDYLKFIKEKDGSESLEFIRGALRGEITQMQNHTLLVRKDGTKVFVADVATPLKDAEENISGAIIVFRDATQEVEIEHMREEMISLTSHELKSPITAIKLMAGMLQDMKLDDKEREYVNNIAKIIESMNSLVGRLLNISRIEQDRIELNIEPIQIEVVTGGAIKELEAIAEERKLDIQVEKLAKPLAKINADPTYLHEVIRNIISNSIKYTKDKVVISYKQEDGAIVLSCADNGLGIPESEQRKIFEKFYRTSNAKESGIAGTGLGLNIAKAIVEKFGGKIWFESEENKGTTFYIRIPIA